MFRGAVNVLDYVMEDYMVLAKYPAFLLDYSDVRGSGRIVIGERETDAAPPTGDSGMTAVFCLSAVLALAGLAAICKRKHKKA